MPKTQTPRLAAIQARLDASGLPDPRPQLVTVRTCKVEMFAVQLGAHTIGIVRRSSLHALATVRAVFHLDEQAAPVKEGWYEFPFRGTNVRILDALFADSEAGEQLRASLATQVVALLERERSKLELEHLMPFGGKKGAEA